MGTSPSVLLIWELFAADGLFHDTNCILVFKSSWNGSHHIISPSKWMVSVGRGCWKSFDKVFYKFHLYMFWYFSVHNSFVMYLFVCHFVFVFYLFCILEYEEYKICSSLVLLTATFIARVKLKVPDFKQTFPLAGSISSCC